MLSGTHHSWLAGPSPPPREREIVWRIGGELFYGCYGPPLSARGPLFGVDQSLEPH